MTFPLMRCLHDWGFPRRWPDFQGHRDVDVQTCAKCGARRLSIVQFGRLLQANAVPAVSLGDCQEAVE